MSIFRARSFAAALTANLLLAEATAGAATILEEEFEDANLGSRGWILSAVPDITAAEAYDGDRSLAVTLAAGATGAITLRHAISPGLSTVYLRYARKFPVGWEWPSSGAQQDLVLVGSLDNINAALDSVYLAVRSEQLADGVAAVAVTDPLQGGRYDGVPYVGTEDEVFTTGTWHLVDVEVRLNTPELLDGELRLWVDHALQVELTGLELRAPEVSELEIDGLHLAFVFPGGSPVAQTFWTDHLIVADSPIGTDAGPTGDGGAADGVPDANATSVTGTGSAGTSPSLDDSDCSCRVARGPRPSSPWAPLLAAAAGAAGLVARRRRRA